MLVNSFSSNNFVNNHKNSFCYVFKSNSSKTDNSNNNPVSKMGEKANLFKETFIAGLGMGIVLLLEGIEGADIDSLKKLTEKTPFCNDKKAPWWKKLLMNTALACLFVGSLAALYTIYKTPQINYQGNINAYKHKKDMDVYIKGNAVEKELYTQMNEVAKNASAEEKAKLRQQYMQMQAAKNSLPDFIKK